MYQLLRKLLFLFPPEAVHYFSMNNLHYAEEIGLIKTLFTKYFTPKDAALAKELFGLHFSNPVGLGAGFDKMRFT